MFETLFALPLPFWVAAAVLASGIGYGFSSIHRGIGIPIFAVLGTIGFWYIGDAFYNDYANYHRSIFTPHILSAAWWQVAWFLTIFLVATPLVHNQMNGRCLQQRSGVLQLFQRGIQQPEFQSHLQLLFKAAVALWMILTFIAAIRLKGEILYYLFPFLGYKPQPWGRDRIGSGFDALLSLAFNFQLLVAAVFGVVAALSTHRYRTYSIVLCFLTWPNFVFDRTRNYMLAAVIPGILCWVMLRLRGGLLKKGLILGVCFLVVNAWMTFVISNRSKRTIVAAVKEKGFSLVNKENARHEGLNMFEELCWLNQFYREGTFSPSWGGRYFAELVNPIPRSLWRGKPLIGIDYSRARAGGGGSAAQAGVYTTISTGLIGQGVINFKGFFGPATAALMMSLWAAFLARLDLNVHKLGRLALYGTGLILTFNLGRDITFITLYPFAFGCLAIWWLEKLRRRSGQALSPATVHRGPTFQTGAASPNRTLESPFAFTWFRRPNRMDFCARPRGLWK